eukprot:SAG22_NODE_261_length_13373_cov_17.745472_12_plen_68_part_00
MPQPPIYGSVRIQNFTTLMLKLLSFQSDLHVFIGKPIFGSPSCYSERVGSRTTIQYSVMCVLVIGKT